MRDSVIISISAGEVGRIVNYAIFSWSPPNAQQSLKLATTPVNVRLLVPDTLSGSIA